MTDRKAALELGLVAASLSPDTESISFTPADNVLCAARHLTGEMDFIRLMFALVDVDDPTYQVVGGYVDALRVDLDDPDLDDRVSMILCELDYPEDADYYATLLSDTGHLAAFRKFPECTPGTCKALLVLHTFIDPCFRGYKFSLALLGELWATFGAGATLCLGHLSEQRQPELLQYWQESLGAVAVGDGLLALPPGVVPRLPAEFVSASRDHGFIKVDAQSLRARFANGDESLFPVSDGRADDPESEGSASVVVATMEAARAAAVAVAARVDDESDVEAEVVTVLRFFVCTADEDAPPSELFIRAAEYLDGHPDLDVVSTSWRDEECPSGEGEHLTLEVTVRSV